MPEHPRPTPPAESQPAPAQDPLPFESDVPPAPLPNHELPTPDTEASANKDREEDLRLLGNSYRVRRFVSEAGSRRTRAWESAKASTRNSIDTPGKIMRQSLHDRAERKVNELKADYQAQRQAIEESGALGRLSAHRLKRLDKKFNRKIKKWEGKLTHRKSSLDARVNRMNARKEAVAKNYEARRAETMRHLKERKEKALARKSLRRELRGGGASWRETHAIMKEITPSERKRIGETALRARASAHAETQATRSLDVVEKRMTHTEASLRGNLSKLEQVAARAREADSAIESINGQAAEQRASLINLQEQLGSLAEGTPEYMDMQVAINQLEEKIRIAEERELPYWHSVALESRRETARLMNERASLELQSRRDEKTATSHIDTLSDARAASERHESEHRDQLKQALNGEPERQEQ